MFEIDKQLINSKVYLKDDTGLCVTGRDFKDINKIFRSSVEKNKLVVCLSDNSASSILIYLLCVYNGVPIMLLDSTIDEVNLNEILEVYSPSIIAGKNVKGEFSILNFGLKKNLNEAEEGNKIHPDLALLLSTSGSTGSKKFVKISKNALIENTKSILDYLPITKNDVAITTLPLAYTYGLSVINTHFKMGAKIVATKFSVLQREFWDLIADEKVTSISGVPYSYEIMIKSGLLKRSLPSLKYMTQAGGNLSTKYKEKLIDYCAKKNIDFYVMYGQTEATSRMSYVPPQSLKKKLTSIGVPISGGSFDLDTSSNEQDEGTGEIVYTGKNVCMGYSEVRSDLSKGDVNNGRLHTGDLGYVDDDGYWYIVGRIKRFSKVFGLRVSLVEIENLAQKILNLDEVIAIEKNGKIQIKYVGVIDEREFKKSLASSTKVHPSAFQLVPVEFIARNESGKIIYK